MKLSEWQNAIRTPSTYRIGNSTLRFQTKFIFLLVLTACIGLFILSFPNSSFEPGGVDTTIHNHFPGSGSSDSISEGLGGKHAAIFWASKNSQKTPYPLTPPVQTEKGLKYRIGIISDLDTESKTSSGKWISYLRKGNLYIQKNSANPKSSTVSVEWEGSEPQVIKSGLNQDGRGMELSELMVYNGKLYSCDDRTGIIFHLLSKDTTTEEIEPIPWVILSDGNGTAAKGFKCEWGCVKGNDLWVGGLGKEWTTNNGELINHDPQFVKKISPNGEVTHIDWRVNYNKMAHELNIHFPGYVIHESAGWSDIHQKWMFLPRRASNEQYHDTTDEKMGTNILILADENFDKIEIRHVGEVIPTHGFSSFKWIPGTDDQLVIALKSEEVEGKTASYMMIFDIHGHILLGETKVGDHKYEGIEFL